MSLQLKTEFKKTVSRSNNEDISVTTLNLLDRIDNHIKAYIIGNLMRNAIEKRYDYSDFLRLCSIVERVPYVDITALRNYLEDNYIFK